MTERRVVGTGVALIVTNHMGQVLMGQRQGSHGAGSWSLIGGWMEHGESFLDTVRREAKEEADILVHRANIITALSTVFPDKDVHSVTVLLHVPIAWWDGQPKRMEPHKLMQDWTWFFPDALPEPLFKPLAEMTDPSFPQLLQAIMKGLR